MGKEIKKEKEKYQYLAKLLGECGEQTDRALAVLLGAELDELLLRILQKYLLPQSNKDIIDLLSSQCPLGSFASRIEIVFRLGIINKIIIHDLHLIRDIRNLFSHRTHGLSFDSQKIKDKVKSFKIPRLKEKNGNALFIDIDLMKSRKAFQGISFFLIGHLGNLYDKIKPVKQKHPFLDKFIKP